MRNKKIKILFLNLLLSLLMITGCSSAQKSIATGSALGAVAGAGVGALADPGPRGQYRIRNAIIGSSVGAVAGAGVGFALDRYNHDEREDAKKEGEKEGNADAAKNIQAGGAGGSPLLAPPKTEAKWIPDQVRGTTFIPGHFEYVIIQAAHWETGQ